LVRVIFHIINLNLVPPSKKPSGNEVGSIFISFIRCCESPKDRPLLSRCIPYLTEGLGNEYDEQVHCTSICALSKLSREFENCEVLRDNGTTKVRFFSYSTKVEFLCPTVTSLAVESVRTNLGL
jgi:hypothetical protein